MSDRNSSKPTVARDVRQRVFAVDLSQPTGVIYVNGLKARNVRGWWWFVRHLRQTAKLLRESAGCLQYKVCFISPIEYYLISWWQSEQDLDKAFKNQRHIDWMRYVFTHPDDFSLINETYNQPISARYFNGRNGYALTQAAASIGD